MQKLFATLTILSVVSLFSLLYAEDACYDAYEQCIEKCDAKDEYDQKCYDQCDADYNACSGKEQKENIEEE